MGGCGGKKQWEEEEMGRECDLGSRRRKEGSI